MSRSPAVSVATGGLSCFRAAASVSGIMCKHVGLLTCKGTEIHDAWTVALRPSSILRASGFLLSNLAIRMSHTRLRILSDSCSYLCMTADPSTRRGTR